MKLLPFELSAYDQFFDSEFPLTVVNNTIHWNSFSPKAIAEQLIRSECEPDIDLALDMYEQAYFAINETNRQQVACELSRFGSSLEVLSSNA